MRMLERLAEKIEEGKTCEALIELHRWNFGVLPGCGAPRKMTCEKCIGGALGLIGAKIEEEFSVRLARSEEDRKAIAWVREKGGMNALSMGFQDADNRRIELCSSLGIDLETGWADAMVAMRRRLMPEGMEWRFVYPDGSPMRLGDRAVSHYGESTITSFEITQTGSYVGFIWGGENDGIHTGAEDVKRPAPKVLDADGVECNVGDAVWWVRNGTGNFRIIRIDPDGKCAIQDDDADVPCGMAVPSTELTHKRPVFDADGVEIKPGETVWLEQNGKGPYLVIDVRDGRTVFEGAVGATPGEMLTHRAPVLAADGKPLRVGETVWGIFGDGPLTVREVVHDDDPDDPEHLAWCGESKGDFKMWRIADELTHERPDSWERLEDDAKAWVNPTMEERAYLVRRAKKLAGVS